MGKLLSTQVQTPKVVQRTVEKTGTVTTRNGLTTPPRLKPTTATIAPKTSAARVIRYVANQKRIDEIQKGVPQKEIDALRSSHQDVYIDPFNKKQYHIALKLVENGGIPSYKRIIVADIIEETKKQLETSEKTKPSSNTKNPSSNNTKPSTLIRPITGSTAQFDGELQKRMLARRDLNK